jgi:uncharacterized protein YceK
MGGIRTDYHIIHAKSSADGWFWPSYCIIDTPFSIGADILFAPYDIYTDYQWSKRTKSSATLETPRQ